VPFKSQAQRRKFAQLLVEGKISDKTFEEWNRETGSRKLPDHVKPKAKSRKSRKPRAKAKRRNKPTSKRLRLYTDHLGFKLEHQQLPAFASVSLGAFMLLLSGPGASGSRPIPGGKPQEPGGWNRVVLRVTDLPEQIEALSCPRSVKHQ